jgi:hypothetical protein
LTRAIPVSYSYSRQTRLKIYENIATADDIRDVHFKKLDLPEEPVFVQPNVNLNMKMIELSMGMEKWEQVYGFRRQTQLQTLMMSNALMNGRDKVTQEDYDAIDYLSKYINMDYKEI